MNGELPFSLVVICTANRFRSPLAAAVIADSLRGHPFAITSRGTLDVGPLPPLLLARRRLYCGTAGGSPLPPVLRDQCRHLVLRVLGDCNVDFEAHHLDAAREAGAAEHTLFGLVDAVELLGRTAPGADPRERISAADALRDRDAPAAEIEDPITKPRDEALAIGHRVHVLALELAGLLRPSGA